MPIIALFIVAFAITFFVFKRRGQKTADCIHKGLVAGIVSGVLVFGILTGLSYF